MAVIFAIGGAAVGVIAIAGYDDYGDYDDYEAYSDAAEKQLKKLVKAKKKEIKSAVLALDDYKLTTVDPYLGNEELKQEAAMLVSVKKMDNDVKRFIKKQQQKEMQEKTADEQARIQEIDRLLERIEDIRREEQQP